MNKYFQLLAAITLVFNVNLSEVIAQNSSDFFKIQVVDAQTGNGVPLVELSTTNNIFYYTDNNGIIAFYEPGLMNQKVYFHLKSHGYEYPKDGFGYQGIALYTNEGESAVIKIKRINIAERLYRITGQGLYHHSELVGYPVPDQLASIHSNGKVMGQDSYNEVVYKGKLYWFWGDTGRPAYPLGNFRTSGATSELPGLGGLDPGMGIALTYFVDSNGFSKSMFPCEKPGPIWMSCMVVLKDKKGEEHLVGSYARIKTLGEAYERGIAIYNDSTEIFEPLIQLELDSPFFPEGHYFRAKVDGVEYLFISNSLPYTIRVQADIEHFTNPESYEAYTCLVEGSVYDKTSPKLDRNKDGHLIYSWKKNTAPIAYTQQQELINGGHIKQEEALVQFRDIETGELIQPHSGTIYWNDYRKRWVIIFQQIWGTSILGEVWYAEGDTPLGPWVYAKKIVTHDNYSFYNVGQHPVFDQKGGRDIYFEGTYTRSFTDNPIATPRYDYNQIMYRLDLCDARLYLPVPVYHFTEADGRQNYQLREGIDSLDLWKQIEDIPFFAMAWDRKIDGLISVIQNKQNGRLMPQIQNSKRNVDSGNVLFYALPFFEKANSKDTLAESDDPQLELLSASPSLVPLYEYQDEQGDFYYSTQSTLPNKQRNEKPICLVWKNPNKSMNFDFTTKQEPYTK